MQDIFDKLKAPFNPEDLEWRINRLYIDKKRATVLAYIDARAIMERLDSVVGVQNWQDTYEVTKDGIICKLSLKVNNEWITKSDGAPQTDYESFKGGISDAFKRAAVKWGIGRYLYKLTETWVDLHEGYPEPELKNKVKIITDKKSGFKGYFLIPDLPKFALPTNYKKEPTPKTMHLKITPAQRRKLFVLMKQAIADAFGLVDIPNNEVEFALKNTIDLKNATKEFASSTIDRLKQVIKGCDPFCEDEEAIKAKNNFISWYRSLEGKVAKKKLEVNDE